MTGQLSCGTSTTTGGRLAGGRPKFMLNSAAILESKLKLVDGVHDTVGMLIASTNDDTIEGIGETPAPSCGKISLD